MMDDKISSWENSSPTFSVCSPGSTGMDLRWIVKVQPNPSLLVSFDQIIFSGEDEVDLPVLIKSILREFLVSSKSCSSMLLHQPLYSATGWRKSSEVNPRNPLEPPRRGFRIDPAENSEKNVSSLYVKERNEISSSSNWVRLYVMSGR